VVVPSGAPVTGDGVTSTAVGGPLTAAGLGVLGLAALIGTLAIRRRKSGKQPTPPLMDPPSGRSCITALVARAARAPTLTAFAVTMAATASQSAKSNG
jgi:hypothetical protein